MAGSELGADFWVGESFTPYDVWQHGVTAVLAHRQTAYQDMAIVQSGPYGKALVLDGKWQTCTGDEFLYHEPIVHTPCVIHGAPTSVLIAGGADGGALREVLKWKSVTKAAVVDIDGEVVAACRELLPEVHQGSFDDPRAEVIVRDAWGYVEGTPGEWDVIIADLTDPIEDGPAYKLFTREFFSLCRRGLRPGGVFVNQAGSTSPPLCHLLGNVAATIAQVFSSVALITAPVPTYGSPWGLLLARQGTLDERPDPDEVDRLLAERLSAPLRMFDGRTMLGLLQPAKYLREMLAGAARVYTLDQPPGGRVGA